MRFLVVGGGGREHALAWRLAQDAEVLCASGNPGIAEDVATENVKATDTEGLAALANRYRPDTVVVGPEDPLVNGLADRLRADGHAVYGPNAAGARLEGSKAFSKEVMAAAGIPTAAFSVFQHPDSAILYARERFAEGFGVVVKASGNAVGKGVIVCDDAAEAEDAIRRMMVDRVFGDAGSTLVIEDRLEGPEFSLLTMVGERNLVSLPVGQDHKRVGDGDTGPNTGGMGVYAPLDWITPDMVAEAEAKFVSPVLAELRRRGVGYRGTLFTGVMMHRGEPFCLEYNCRFGDPETETIMPMIESGFAAAIHAAATGELITAPVIRPVHSCSVFVSSRGYPGIPETGFPITLGPIPASAKLFHAGTSRNATGELVNSGGRVIAAVATGDTAGAARDDAYAAAMAVRFEGAFYRRDIGAR